jgi:hypothetical protein
MVLSLSLSCIIRSGREAKKKEIKNTKGHVNKNQFSSLGPHNQLATDSVPQPESLEHNLNVWKGGDPQKQKEQHPVLVMMVEASILPLLLSRLSRAGFPSMSMMILSARQTR